MFDSRAETNEKNWEQTEVQNSKVSNGKYSRFLLVLLFFRLPRQKSLYILKYDGNFQQFNQLIYSEKKRDDWESLNTFMCLYEWQIFDMRVFFVCALHLYSIANLFVWFCIFDGVFFLQKEFESVHIYSKGLNHWIKWKVTVSRSFSLFGFHFILVCVI